MAEPNRWYVKDAPSILVENYGGYDASDITGSYWIVKIGDGTQYRLGYTDDAISWQSQTNQTDKITGWLVDTITDQNGNQIQYTYENNVGTGHTQYHPNFEAVSYEAHPLFIHYNFPSQVTTPPSPQVGRYNSTTAATEISFCLSMPTSEASGRSCPW